MTTTTLEKPQTNSSTAPRSANPALRTASSSASRVITAGSPRQQERADDPEILGKQGTSLLSRSVRALKDGAFQLGFSAPGKLWYRDSTRLNAKEKALFDAQLQGIW